MKVFIGWSGDRSRALAHALREWMPLVLHYVEPWLSEADIGAGERWALAIAQELEASNFGVLCVTRENVASPWVLFEAGALAKSMQESRVIPLLLDLDFSDISGPLAQFQSKKVDQSGLGEVIHSINQATDQPIPEERARELVELLWPKFEAQMALMPGPAQATKHNRPQPEILEELVAGVRSLDTRLREVENVVSAGAPGPSRYRRVLRDPMYFRELAHMLSDGPRDPVLLLCLASMLRDDAPWLYELGVEAYRAARGRSGREAPAALHRFLRGVELLQRGPVPPEELGMDPRSLHVVLRELEPLVAMLSEAGEGPPTKARGEQQSRGQ